MSGQENNDQNTKRQGRYQFLMASFGPKIFDQLQTEETGRTFGDDIETAFATFASYDPTSEGNGRKYVYLQWLCSRYVSAIEEGNPITVEELQQVRDDIEFFFDLKKRRRHDDFEKDINRHTPVTLAALREEYTNGDKVKSKNEMLRDLRDEIRAETDVHYDGPEGIIVSPKTERASQYWGQGTTWCTAQTNSQCAFNTYNINGPLVIYIPSGTEAEKDRTQTKYQGHVNSTIKHSGNTDPLIMPANFRGLVEACIKQDPDKLIFFIEHGHLRHDHISRELHTKESWLLCMEKGDKILSNSLLGIAPAEFLADEGFCVDAIKYDDSLLYLKKEHRTPAVYAKAATIADEQDTFLATLKEMQSRHGKNAIRNLDDEKTGVLKERIIRWLEKTDARNLKEYLKVIPAPYWKKDGFCEQVLNHHISNEVLRYIPKDRWRNEEFSLKILEKLPIAIFGIPESSRTKSIYQCAALRIESEEFAKLLDMVPGNCWQDEEFAKAMVDRHYAVLSRIPEENRTKDICLAAAKATPSELFIEALNRIPAVHWENEGFCSDLVAHNTQAFSYISEQYRSKKICSAALENMNGQDRQRVLEAIPPGHAGDEEFARYLAGFGAQAFLVIPEGQRTKEVCKIALAKCSSAYKAETVLSAIPEEHWQSDGFAKSVVEQHGSTAYAAIPESYRNKELALKAVTSSKTQKDRVSIARQVPAEQWADPVFVLRMVDKDYMIYTALPAEQKTKEVTLKTLQDLKQELYRNNVGELFRNIPSEQWLDIDVCERAFAVSGLAREYMSPEIRDTMFPSLVSRFFNAIFGPVQEQSQERPDQQSGRNDGPRPSI